MSNRYGYAVYTQSDLLGTRPVESASTTPVEALTDFLVSLRADQDGGARAVPHPGWARDGRVFILAPVYRDSSLDSWRPCGSRQSAVVRWVVPAPEGHAEVVKL